MLCRICDDVVLTDKSYVCDKCGVKLRNGEKVFGKEPKPNPTKKYVEILPGDIEKQRSLARYFNPNTRRYLKNTADKLKRNVFELYGGVKCACCGETNIKFLTLDHKHNDGKEHRQSVGKGKSMYSWALKNYSPDIFQVLCYNCNYGKAKNGGICPHENS